MTTARPIPAEQENESGVASPPQFPSTSGRVRASLHLDFQFDRLAQRTQLAASHQEPPLRVVRAFAHDDGAALVHLHNVSGGLLGGDHLSLAARLGPEAHVQITTTGATRIYRPRENAPPTIQSSEITLAEDALLEYVPDPLIPFAGARFSQQTSIHLAQGAGLFWWEILSPGREARGEVFEYESLHMKTDVTAAGRLIAAEQIRLEPKNRSLASLARLGPYRTWATFYICRVGVEPAAWLGLEHHLRDVAAGLRQGTPSLRARALWSVSTLPAHGMVVRCVATHGRDVTTGLHELWRAAKLRLYGCEPVLPRKVN